MERDICVISNKIKKTVDKESHKRYKSCICASVRMGFRWGVQTPQLPLWVSDGWALWGTVRWKERRPFLQRVLKLGKAFNMRRQIRKLTPLVTQLAPLCTFPGKHVAFRGSFSSSGLPLVSRQADCFWRWMAGLWGVVHGVWLENLMKRPGVQGCPFLWMAGFQVGPGCWKLQQGWANSSHQYLKMVVSSLTVWAAHCGHSASLAWVTHPFAHLRKSRIMAGNWERPRPGERGVLAGHAGPRDGLGEKRRSETPEFCGQASQAHRELAFGSSLHSSRWRWSWREWSQGEIEKKIA